MHIHRYTTCMLLAITILLAACTGISDPPEEPIEPQVQGGVLILCEGNYNSGNASLCHYDPYTRHVERGVFRRTNDRRLGDTGQSITLGPDGTAYIAMENSGIIWALDTRTLRVRGQLTSSQAPGMINPRYVHITEPHKAYVTDLYSPYITTFDPTTMTPLGNIPTGQPSVDGYSSTEQMAQWGDSLYVCCWSYSRDILVIDTQQDRIVHRLTLDSPQPRSIVCDRRGRLWVITDGGYQTAEDSYGDNIPHLYRIDASTLSIELDLPLPQDEAAVQIALSPDSTQLYVLNNDIYRLDITDQAFPSQPLIPAPTDSQGRRHKLYGLAVHPTQGDVYVADAVDYAQSGVVYRYSSQGQELDHFRVGINPCGFAFLDTPTQLPQDVLQDNQEDRLRRAMVSHVYEYMPAPGHQVNGYSVVGDLIRPGATMQEACDTVLSHFRHRWMVSLGGQGGYLVAGFDHDVTNSRGGYDLAIKGNPYSYQSEPGIIWVSADDNGDGLPNDTWYELAGSEYGTPNHTQDYAITYYRPTAPAQDIAWSDNQGGSGTIPYMPEWNTHPTYWQDWVPTQTDSQGRQYRTYYGSRLRDRSTYHDGISLIPPYDWGYADNQGSDYFLNDNFCNIPMGYYRLSQAVNFDGTPAHLSHIRFVRIQTAQTGSTPNLGEISTEVYGIWDCHIQ